MGGERIMVVLSCCIRAILPQNHSATVLKMPDDSGATMRELTLKFDPWVPVCLIGRNHCARRFRLCRYVFVSLSGRLWRALSRVRGGKITVH